VAWRALPAGPSYAVSVFRTTWLSLFATALASKSSVPPPLLEAAAVFVVGESFDQVGDPLFLLVDDLLKLADATPAVVCAAAGAAAVVAARAGGDEILWLPEQVQRSCSADLESGRRGRSGRARLCGAAASAPSSSRRSLIRSRLTVAAAAARRGRRARRARPRRLRSSCGAARSAGRRSRPRFR
jgi:hypothetical protein